MDAAFLHHKDSELIRNFKKVVQSFPQKSDFQDGFKIGSFCTGWGVAEMVLQSLNMKISELVDGVQAGRRIAQICMGSVPTCSVNFV